MRRAAVLLWCLSALVLAGCGAASMAAEASGNGAEPPAVLEETADYGVYAPFGLTYDPDTDTLTFDGRTVRYFLDGAELEDGAWAVRCEHVSETGTVDVRAVRTVLSNEDGSTDPFGPLTGVEAYSQEEFDRRDMEALLRPASTAVTEASGDDTLLSGESIAERFAVWRDFGVEYVEDPDGGVGNVYLHGRLVNAFVDISLSGTFTFHSAGGGDVSARTVYDAQGTLLRVELLPA